MTRNVLHCPWCGLPHPNLGFRRQHNAAGPVHVAHCPVTGDPLTDLSCRARSWADPATNAYPLADASTPLPATVTTLKRTGGIGDVLMVAAVARELARAGRAVNVLTSYPRLFAANPDVAHINRPGGTLVDLDWTVESPTVDPRGRCPERDYESSPRLDLLFRAANLQPPPFPRLHYHVAPGDLPPALSDGSPLIVYVLHSTSPVRTYPVDLAVEVLDALVRNFCRDTCRPRYRLAVLGQPRSQFGSDHPFTVAYERFVNGCAAAGQGQLLDLTDRTTFEQAAAVIAQGDVAICPDSGLLHLAAAVQTPTVSLHGPIHPDLRVSYYDNCVPLFGRLPCATCCDRDPLQRRYCPDWRAINDYTVRQIGAGCMRAISPQQILAAVRDLLGSPGSDGNETSRVLPLVLPFCQGQGQGVDLGGVGSAPDHGLPGATVVDSQKGREPSVVADCRHLPMFADGQLDYVYSSHLLEDFTAAEIPAILREWFRLLKPGGHFVLYCPVQQVYARHCRLTGQSQNPQHKEENFCLRFVKPLLPPCEIVLEKKLLNNYSFLLIARKI